MKIRVQDLDGRLLDVATALCLGYTWVKNASSRSGDSYLRKGEKPMWPTGCRCLVSPSKAKNISPTEKNWDGWLESDMSEPMTSSAIYDVPNYTKNPNESWPIIDREGISLLFKGHNKEWHASKDVGGHVEHGHQFVFVSWGYDSITAALRCFVSYSNLAAEIDIPDKLVEMLERESKAAA